MERRSNSRTSLRLIAADTRRDGDEPEHFNLRIVQPLLRYVRQQMGEAALDEIAAETGLTPETMRRSSAWISHDRMEAVMAAARGRMASDQEFLDACGYDISKVYGPMLLVLRCMSIRRAFSMITRTVHLVSRVARIEIVESTRTSVRLRYYSSVPESRLMCLSRQAQYRVGPTIYWGVAPARVEVVASIAAGDPYCEYEVHWYQAVRWRGPLVGAALGIVTAALLPALVSGIGWGTQFLLPLLGVLLGLILEQRRLVGDQIRFSEHTNHELERLVQAHAHAVDEVLDLHQRERQWSQQLELAVAQRAAQIDRMAEQLENLGEPRRDRVRALSHDINNPLAVLHGIAAQLRRNPSEEEGRELVHTLEACVQQISELVRELANTVRDDSRTSRFQPEIIDVDDLAARVRRQLRATVVGRDIRVTVFQTREAPPTIYSVRVMLERVVDNIMTNAAKYTSHGSIIVEVGGTPGFLVLKVSDTGRGIHADRLEEVLRAAGPDPNPPTGGSQGTGIGIVSRLLDQLGGRLEIMSEPGEGTTAWIYVPSEGTPDVIEFGVDGTGEPIESVMRRVVKIRVKHRLKGSEHA